MDLGSLTASGSPFGNASNGPTALYAAPNHFGDFNIAKPYWLSDVQESNGAYLLAGAAVIGLAVYLWKLKK